MDRPLRRLGRTRLAGGGVRGLGGAGLARLGGRHGVAALLVSTVGWFVTSRVSTTVDDLSRGLSGNANHFVAGFAVYNNALLLFTLERTCDAIANGEAKDLGLDRDRLLAVLRRQIESAFAPAPARSGAAGVVADADLRAPRRQRTAPHGPRRPR